MTTKELLKNIENRSPFILAWAVLWRLLLIYIGGAFAIGFIGALLGII